MKRKSKGVIEELEKMVFPNEHHHFHKDPVERISNSVIALIFLSIFILFMVFAFLNSLYTQGPTPMQTYALVQFEPIDMGWLDTISSNVSSFVDTVQSSENRPVILLAFYTMWIIVVGIANLVHFERKRRK
jgi:hypothetical protein